PGGRRRRRAAGVGRGRLPARGALRRGALSRDESRRQRPSPSGSDRHAKENQVYRPGVVQGREFAGEIPPGRPGGSEPHKGGLKACPGASTQVTSAPSSVQSIPGGSVTTTGLPKGLPGTIAGAELAGVAQLRRLLRLV